MKPDIERSFIAVQDTKKLGINASVSIVVMLSNVHNVCVLHVIFAPTYMRIYHIEPCSPSCVRGWCNHNNGVCQCPSGWTGSTCSSGMC